MGRPSSARCERCKQPLPAPAATGRPRRFCSDSCRVIASRKRSRSRAHRDAWWTPAHIRERVHAEWELVLDAAACETSTLVPDSWLGPRHDDLDRRDALAYDSWEHLTVDGGTRRPPAIWLNPPYFPTSVMAAFLQRAAATRDAGLTVVALIPASVGAHWWHDNVLDLGGEVETLRGRLSFDGPHSSGGAAPWPSALVTFRAS